MSLSTSTAIFGLSLTAIPATYIVNTASNLHGEIGLLISGVVSLSVICFLTHLIISRKGTPRDPLFYVMTISTFGNVASLIISLEADGIIRGFMSNYLNGGEPYLKTSHGILISYWDGIGHYACCLMMLAALSWNQSFRHVGLYWAGSIGHSMVVFIPGNIVGKYGLHASFLLNVPYMIMPFWAMARFLRDRPKETPVAVSVASKEHSGIFRRPLDLVFVVSMVIAMAVACLRGLAVLGASNFVFQDYIKYIEPYLEDPVAYPKIQMLVYMFYYIPYYVFAVVGLLYPGHTWMVDWALIHAGASAQAQVAHIGSSIHYRTPYKFRVPHDKMARGAFWGINGVLLTLIPHLLAYRCVQRPEFFKPVAPDTTKDGLSKKLT